MFVIQANQKIAQHVPFVHSQPLIANKGARQTCNIFQGVKVKNFRVNAQAKVQETQEVDQSYEQDLLNGVILHNGVVDYYQLLGVDDNADMAEIKASYRQLAKVFHPDKMGEKGHAISILLNEGYNTLTKDDSRKIYNDILQEALQPKEDADFTGQPLSIWSPTQDVAHSKHHNPQENRGVFVDESTCIGCTNCLWCAEKTFFMEDEFGRSRVKSQWADSEDDLNAAIASCPVDCIHWVDKEQLPSLEYLMQKKYKDRVNVGLMMGGSGNGNEDVFAQAKRWLRDREQRKEILDLRSKYSKIQAKARKDAEKKQEKFDSGNEELEGVMGIIQKLYGYIQRYFNLVESQAYQNVYGYQDKNEVGARLRKEQSFARRHQMRSIPKNLALVNRSSFENDYRQMRSVLGSILESEHLQKVLVEQQSRLKQMRIQEMQNQNF